MIDEEKLYDVLDNINCKIDLIKKNAIECEDINKTFSMMDAYGQNLYISYAKFDDSINNFLTRMKKLNDCVYQNVFKSYHDLYINMNDSLSNGFTILSKNRE